MTQSDPMLERIEAFNRDRGGGVVVRRQGLLALQ
jgi:hypothetical protein